MSDTDDEQKNYITESISGLFFIGFVSLFWDDIWPWGFWDVWEIKTPFWEWLEVGVPVFVWAVAVNFFFNMFRDVQAPVRRRSLIQRIDVKAMFTRGFLTSLFAGVTEELAFRWILPYAAVPTLLLMNWLFFGFLGFGINEWFHTTIWSPFANFTTFDLLLPQLMAKDWVIGACILYSNAFFRNGHKYQGWFGYVNSWFMGMYLWFVCIHHGLLAAIVVHFLYDLVIDIYGASYVWLRQRMG
jgi:hypothetical protein